MDPNEERVITTVSQAGGVGMSYTALKGMLSVYIPDTKAMSELLRKLVTDQKISFTKNSQGEHMIVKREPVPEKLAIILEALKSYGSNGGDSAQIATKTKMPKPEVTKGIQQLITQGLVRETRSITNRAKKMFVLAEFVGSVEVTGGAFYNEQRELDVRFVDAVRQCLVKFIQNRANGVGLAVGSLGGMHTAICSVDAKQQLDTEGLSKQLSLVDVERALGSLVLDGILVRVGNTEEQKYRLAPTNARQTIGGTQTNIDGAVGKDIGGVAFLDLQRETLKMAPCLGCPLLLTCNIGNKGIVNTNQCPYLDEWLTPIATIVNSSHTSLTTGGVNSRGVE